MSPLWTRVAVGSLLAVFAAQTVLGMRLLNASADETVHLPAGYTYVKTGQLRLNPEHPPLVKQLCGLPLLLLAPNLNLEDPDWKAEPPRQVPFGYRFLYSNDADRLLFWGRMPVVALAIVLGIYVFRWSTELFGPGAGVMAVFLFAFSPNVIAHSRFVTMDLPLACFFVMTLYHLRRFLSSGSRRSLVATGLGLGLALGAKFSALVLLPAVVCLVGLAATGPADGAARGGRVLRLAGSLAMLFAIAALVVSAIYFFPADPLFYWEGLSQVNKNHNPYYKEYLMGEFDIDGWWYYFLLAFLFKTPVPTLALLLASLLLWRRYRSGNRLEEAFLVVPAVIFTAVTSAFADNIGIRYLLPAYPLLFIFVSRSVRLITATRLRAAAGGLLAAWYLGSALWIYPDQLAYFNELVGGPANGHRYLDDSNIDWGQDLKRLKAWQDERGVDTIKLLYLWRVSPDYYGLRWERVRTTDWEGEPSPGVYAMSTHMLIRGELVAREQGTKNNWLSLYEPIGRIGYSIYLFEFGEAEESARLPRPAGAVYREAMSPAVARVVGPRAQEVACAP